MRSFIVPFIIALIAAVGAFGQGPQSPKMSSQATRLEPRVARAGTVLTITGVALGKAKVEEVYLTDHTFDMKVKVLEQTDTMLKVRVPPFAKPGRQQLLFLTTGQDPSYLEQPVYVLVELADEATVTKVETPALATGAGDKPPNNN